MVKKIYKNKKLVITALCLALMSISFTGMQANKANSPSTTKDKDNFVYLLPDAEGTVQAWSSTGASHYTEVDDSVGSPDEDATYVYTSTKVMEDFNHKTSDSLNGATITNVKLTVRVKVTALATPPDNHAINLGLKINGMRYSAPLSIFVYTSYANYAWNWAVNPATGQAWTKTVIDNLQSSILVIHFAITSNMPEMRCTQIYFTVSYT
jgi:hypothetical protein